MADGTHADHRAAGQRRQLRGAPRRPGGVRAVRAAGGDGQGPRRRRSRIVLARRRYRGDRAVAPTASTRCARSPASTAPVAAIWRSPNPTPRRRLKGAVVANQLARLGGYQWRDEDSAAAEPVGDGGATGWRTRVRLDTSAEGRAGFHRYHSSELVTELDCAQLPAGMLDGLHDWAWPPGAQLHVAVDDDGDRHVVQSGPRTGRKTTTQVVEGSYEAVQRVGERVWRVPVTAFWQAHRDAARVYSELVADWAQLDAGHDGVGFVRRRRGFRGGAGAGRRRAGQASSPSTRRAGRRGRRAQRWPTSAGCRWSPTRCAGRWPAGRRGPTWRCWTRRGPGQAAR